MSAKKVWAFRPSPVLLPSGLSASVWMSSRAPERFGQAFAFVGPEPKLPICQATNQRSVGARHAVHSVVSPSAGSRRPPLPPLESIPHQSFVVPMATCRVIDNATAETNPSSWERREICETTDIEANSRKDIDEARSCQEQLTVPCERAKIVHPEARAYRANLECPSGDRA